MECNGSLEQGYHSMCTQSGSCSTVGQDGLVEFLLPRLAATRADSWSRTIGRTLRCRIGKALAVWALLSPSSKLSFTNTSVAGLLCFTLFYALRSQRESMERVMARIFQQNRNWAGEHAREKGAAGGEESLMKCLLSDVGAKTERVCGAEKRTRMNARRICCSESVVEKGSNLKPRKLWSRAA